MGRAWILLGMLCFSLMLSSGNSRKAACHDPMYASCYGIRHNCPAGCPTLCQVDCRLCKPYCACDKPGAICQDPRFIGGDGILFYFHGKKDKEFCLVSDSKLHINAHFIGKRSKKGRDLTWVHSIGILFGSHRFYLGARSVSKWQESAEHTLMQLDGEDIIVPTGEQNTWQSKDKRLTLRRLADTNEIEAKVEGLFEIVARVVPITPEESRVHGYDVTEENCYTHLELNFKFDSLTKTVDGVLGQTYRPSYQSRVKMAAAMPIMGGAEKFAASHIFAADCAVSNFAVKKEGENYGMPSSIDSGHAFSGSQIACRR